MEKPALEIISALLFFKQQGKTLLNTNPFTGQELPNHMGNEHRTKEHSVRRAQQALEMILKKPLKIKAVKVYLNIGCLLCQNQLSHYHKQNILQMKQFRTSGKETEMVVCTVSLLY